MSQIELKNAKTEIPEGAVLISRQKALEMQWGLVKNWEPRSDLWFFRFGVGILSASSIISSTFIMQYYRKRLKLFTYGRPVMFIPGVIFPALAIPAVYQKAVMEPILLQDHCPVCIQMRGISNQTMASIGYPTLVHSVSSLMLANSFATYRVPEFKLRNPVELLAFWQKISKRLSGTLPFHFLLQFLVAIWITEMQAKEIFKIQGKIAQNQSLSTQ